MTAYELANALKDDWADKFRFDAADMLRQQADRIAELEKDFAWAKDQWNKDRICFESRRNELEKDLALKTRDRDVFCNFTLAYEKRIEELEKLEQDFIRVIKQTNPNKPQTKPLSNDEIREIGEDCELKNNGILNWIDFAKAIEERHGIK